MSTPAPAPSSVSASASATVAAPSASASASSAEAGEQTIDAEERARILAGVGEMHALVRARVAARISDDTEASCDARQKKVGAAYRSAVEKVGPVRVFRFRTRFADDEATRGQTLDLAVTSCLLGCLIEEQGPKAQAEVLASCKQAKTVLDDFTDSIVKTRTN
jgi:hypothetical protein